MWIIIIKSCETLTVWQRGSTCTCDLNRLSDSWSMDALCDGSFTDTTLASASPQHLPVNSVLYNDIAHAVVLEKKNILYWIA